jgi:hypothetical protein
VRSNPWGVTLLEDVVMWEANRAVNERQRVQKQRRRHMSAAQVAAEACGEETPSKSESSGDGGEEEDENGEGEIISPTQSPTPENLLSLDELFGRQMGIPARIRQAKHPRADAGGASSLPSQPNLELVCSFW